MTGLTVESVLARCLLDADFLRDVSADPDGVLSKYGLDEVARGDFRVFDFGRVRDFAGFITKVQHNDLWESVPYTRALLKYYGLEIEIFAVYHGTHLRLRAMRPSREEKTRSFIDFVERYVGSGAGAERPGLRDILEHERIQLDVRNALNAMERDAPFGNGVANGGGPFATLVPTVVGVLRVMRFEYSPLAIASRLVEGGFDPGELVAHRHCLAYWGEAATGLLHILEIDEVTAAVLGEVDGRRSVRSIVRRVTNGLERSVPVSRLRPIFDGAVECGLLALLPRGVS